MSAVAALPGPRFEGVALTLDHDYLDPFAPDLAYRVKAVRRR